MARSWLLFSAFRFAHARRICSPPPCTNSHASRHGELRLHHADGGDRIEQPERRVPPLRHFVSLTKSRTFCSSSLSFCNHCFRRNAGCSVARAVAITTCREGV